MLYVRSRWTPAAVGLGLVSLAINFAGCGARGFAPDALVEDPGASAFLSQVRTACGNLNVGTATVAYLIQSQDDVYFVDETSKLYFGDVSRAQYADDISGFYPIGNSSKAVECIVQQLAGERPQR